MNEELQEHYVQVLWEKFDTLIDRLDRVVTLLETATMNEETGAKQ
jgi:hypothetical protein